ncbi:hypothetical protein H6F88_01050 [Oculatella sp. FACHB-28]|uniref:hypothetical protein n=1 Tax=Oculatella sp. FACHB-28 TaxID=2692845 RepID=UPI00168237D3|nr:hypothetical protein [Oculatella sp. FACHB-28]MBD2054628.1 hypothetical protein [Oculatella sp. FACHB-28]
MKTLIITVGTRQIGWRCKDGVVRSLGADGDRGHPKHIDQLFAEFGIERGYHGDEHKPEFRWSVRYLGDLLYRHCVKINDFSNVELLLDGAILETAIKNGLDHIILWGTDQPEETFWNFRRADTLWLAKLMEGKIRQVYPQVEVDVWNPVVPVNKTEEIRQEVEGFILKYALDRLKDQSSQNLTLMIQAKGSVPQIANTLEICAAALMRQCPVEQVIPVEPTPLFEGETARIATEFKTISLGQYFWPVERERIVSAWKRGDFTEAAVWLESHRDRYESIYKLARHIALASNGEAKASFLELRNWSSSRAVAGLIPPSQLQTWREQLSNLTQKQPIVGISYQLAWEEVLFIELALRRANCTIAFMQFAQLAERLLYVQCKANRWLQNQVIVPQESYRGRLEDYNAGFGGLLRGWYRVNKFDANHQWVKLTDAIREKRNEVVHQGKSVNEAEIRSLWRNIGCDDSLSIFELMLQVLHKVTENQWKPPSNLLLRSLYEWGLEKLS